MPKGPICKFRPLFLSLILSACSSGYSPLSSHSGRSFEGFWRGRMITSNELTRKVALDVYQTGGELKGQYRCAFGSTQCLNNISAGTVSGSLDAPSFEVKLQDGTVCRFSGRFAEDQASGEYSCYIGANLIDHGSWELSRADPQKDEL